MRRKSLHFLLVFLIILGAGVGYIGGSRLLNEKKIPEPFVEPLNKQGANQNPPSTSIAPTTWKTYYHQELGMSFSYPKGYCVGFFSKQDLVEHGYRGDQEEYFIKIAENIPDQEREKYERKHPNIPLGSPCDAPFGPGDPDILGIAAFRNSNGNVDSWLTAHRISEIKQFFLPLITVDGLQATRYISGEGSPNKGMPRYSILFQKDDLIFILSTIVNCTAADGSCSPPRGYQFIEEIDRIVKSFRFIR